MHSGVQPLMRSLLTCYDVATLDALSPCVLSCVILMRSLLAYYIVPTRKKFHDEEKRRRREDLGSLWYVSRRATLKALFMCM